MPTATASEKPSAVHDSTAISLPFLSHLETGAFPWPVAHAVGPFKPIKLPYVLSGTRPFVFLSQAGTNGHLAVRPTAAAEVSVDVADKVHAETVATNYSLRGLFAELQASEAAGIHNNTNAPSTGVVLARLSRSVGLRNTSLFTAYNHHHTQTSVTFCTAWGLPFTVCILTTAVLLMYGKHMRLQKRVEALELLRPLCKAGTPTTRFPSLYQHEYYCAHYEAQIAERGNRHNDAQPGCTDCVQPPTLLCRGEALEVDETARRLFPNLAIPPATDPSLVRSVIKLTPVASDIGIEVPGYGLVTVLNARDILLAINDVHGEPGVSNQDLDVQLLRAAMVVWIAGNMVAWAEDKPDLNMLGGCSGTLPPTPADLRRNMRYVSRKGVGEAEEEFRSVLQDLTAEDKHGQWRCNWQDAPDGTSATIADCCYSCCALWDGQAACGSEPAVNAHLEYVVLSCQGCASVRGRCGEYPLCMNCAGKYIKMRNCPYQDNTGAADHVASSERTVPQTFLRAIAFS